MKRVSVVGLGKLGSCMSACIAAKGYTVIGVDTNERAVDAVNRLEPPVFEPGLGAMMTSARGRLSAVGDTREAVHHTDITFIVVPTPSDPSGAFSTKYVQEVGREIGSALRDKRDYHLVVLTSTVLPGATEQSLLSLLEAESEKRAGKHFGLCYNPEFIALGTVLRDFMNPDFVLIGEGHPGAADPLATLYHDVCENDPPLERMSIVNAELAKIAVNTYVTMKITFANMLTALCEKLPGANVDTVTQALGKDKRIGPHCLKGALGYGGPCFPRDNIALAHFAQTVGERALLAEATDAYNRTIVPRLADRIRALVPPGGTIAVLGMAYKPGTNVVEESQGLQLADALAKNGHVVFVYDPVAMENTRRVLGDRVRYARDVAECMREADVVVLANPEKEFGAIRHPARPKQTVVDAWRFLRPECDGSVYVPLGVGLATSPSMLAVSEA